MSKTALITGATSGLGLSYAKYFASEGYHLIITGRRENVINENAGRLRDQFLVDVEVIPGDLSNPEGVKHLIEQIEHKEIDVLVNNAGFGLKPTFAGTSEKEIDEMLYLHIGCVTRLTRAVLTGMVSKSMGLIINISSDGAFAVLPHNVLYSSTKLYILNFTEGLHMELAETNIRVQAVCPGFIDSHFHENAGMHMDKNKRGLFGFRQPDDIVRDAMKDLRKGKVVSVPDFSARLMKNLVRFLPRKIFYKMAVSFSRSMTGKKTPGAN